MAAVGGNAPGGVPLEKPAKSENESSSPAKLEEERVEADEKEEMQELKRQRAVLFDQRFPEAALSADTEDEYESSSSSEAEDEGQEDDQRRQR